MYEDEVMQTLQGWWVLRNDTLISRWVEESGRLDHDQVVLQKLAPYIKPGSVVYDLGAAIGDHTLFYLGAVGSTGSVIAFEPHPVYFECLQRNCSKAVCLPYAVGESEGDTWILHESGNVASSCLINPEVQAPMSKVRCVMIDTTPILSLSVSFIKIDIEGSEVRALRGARETILRHRPAIWLEIYPGALARQGFTVNDLRQVLGELRYQVAEFYPSGSWENPPHLCDALCLPL